MPTRHLIKTIQEIGHLVREERRHLGKTQEELSGIVGVGTRFISELERGKPTLEIERVLRVLDFLGLDVWLIPRKDRTYHE